jgi:hypothetical protein
MHLVFGTYLFSIPWDLKIALAVCISRFIVYMLLGLLEK